MFFGMMVDERYIDGRKRSHSVKYRIKASFLQSNQL